MKGPPRQPQALSLWAAIAFSAASLPISAVSLAIGVYLPRHYASHLGLELTAVGAAFFLVRMIDIPVDALLGWGMDRTRTALGRYRFWTLIGTPIFALGTYQLFLPPDDITRNYLIFWLLVMYLGNSIMTISHVAWAVTLAPKYDQRSRLFGILAAVGVTGAASVIFVPVVNNLLGGTDSSNVNAMGLLVLVLTPITVGLVLLTTPETVTKDTGGPKFKLREYLSLVTRPSFRRILLADLCLSLGPGWMSASYLFFFTDSRGFSTAQASVLLAIYILAGMIGAPSMARLAMRISKHRAVMVGAIGFSVVTSTFLAIPQGSMFWGAVALFSAGFLSSSFTAITRAMTADVADEVRLEGGKEMSALLYAMTAMTSKITGAVAIGLTFFVLSQVGYVAKEGVVNSAEAIRHLEWVYLAGPIFFVSLGAVCLVGYHLDSETHSEIRRQLDHRDAFYNEAAVLEGISAEHSAGVSAEDDPSTYNQLKMKEQEDGTA